MRVKYGMKLRKFLKENIKIIKIIDFSGYSVFAQTVDTNILLFQKIKPHYNHNLSFINVQNHKEKDIITFIKNNFAPMQQNKLSYSTWTLTDDKILKLKEKIEKIGIPLKNWDVKIYFGIKTGFNKAFIVTTEYKLQN